MTHALPASFLCLPPSLPLSLPSSFSLSLPQDIDTAPPVPLSHADARARLVAQEMLRYKEEVLLHYRQGLCADLSTFWLRKTEKPVLAVLLVQKDRAPPLLYRGCNMEVSMPTGSLCAERNAIGSALAADLTLKRRDLKVVAV